MHATPSWELRVIHHTLVVCSMALSAYFGWSIGEGVFPLNLILAVLCAVVAFGVATMFRRAAEYDQEGYRLAAIRCWIIGSLFLFANIIFDYSSAAALREQVAVHATNQNVMADDVRARIKSVETEISARERETAWRTELRSPQAYQAEIDQLEGDRIFTRSKRCGDVSLPDSRDLCEKRKNAIAAKSMAERRIQLLEEVKQLRSERDTLMGRSETTQHAANPALAQIKMLGSWFTLTRNPTEAQAFWTQNSVMLVMAILVNIGLAYLGHEMGSYRTAAPVGAQIDPDPPRYAPQFALRDERPPEARAADPSPIPLRPAPGAATTANIAILGDPGQRSLTKEEWDRVMGNVSDAIAKARADAKRAG